MKIAADLFSLFLPGPMGDLGTYASGESPLPRKPERMDPVQLHYFRCINRAELEGNRGLAEAILQMYRERFPTP